MSDAILETEDGPLLATEPGTGGEGPGDGGDGGTGDGGDGGTGGSDKLSDIKNRLLSFGYTFNPETDEWLLSFLIVKVEQEIKTFCNLTEVPADLHHVVVDRVCGEFLSARKVTGGLAGIDMESVVKSIKEGDTALTYALDEKEALTFDGLIRALINAGKERLTAFRRLRW
jgi:hypothetical protein